MHKHRYGNSEIMYGTDGRLHLPAMGGREQIYPQHTYSGQLPSHQDQRAMDFDTNRRRDRERERYHPHDTRPNSGPYRSDLPYNQTFRSEPEGRRYQNRPLPSPRGGEGDYIRPVGTVYPNYNFGNPHGYNHTARKLDSPWQTPVSGRKNYDKTGLIVERNRSRSTRSAAHRKKAKDSGGSCCERWITEWPVTATFLLAGLLLIGLGVTNVLICTETNVYSHFWVGTMAIVTGIMGAVHRGRYNMSWASVEYWICAVLLTIFAMVGTGFLFDSLVPTIKGLIDADGDMLEYLKLHPPSTDYRLKNISAVDRAWICLGVDIGHGFLLLVCYIGLLAGVVVLEKYWSSTNEFHVRIRPFSSPMFFNPFSQLPIGEVMVFFGLLTVFACTGSEWQKYYSPVWAGGLAAAAGLVGAVAERQPNSKTKNQFCVILEFLAFAASVIAVVFCTMGMIDNVKLLDDADVVNNVNLNRHLIASACIFAFADVPCLVNIFYSIVIMVKSIQVIMTEDTLDFESRSDMEGKSSYSQSVTSFDSTPRNNGFYNRHLAGGPVNSRWARY